MAQEIAGWSRGKRIGRNKRSTEETLSGFTQNKLFLTVSNAIITYLAYSNELKITRQATRVDFQVLAPGDIVKRSHEAQGTRPSHLIGGFCLRDPILT